MANSRKERDRRPHEVRVAALLAIASPRTASAPAIRIATYGGYPRTGLVGTLAVEEDLDSLVRRPAS